MILIYSCVFIKSSYIQLFHLLLKTLKEYGKPDNNVHFLVLCDASFQNQIESLFKTYDITGFTWVQNVHSVFHAAYSRLFIFHYENINLYDRIIYLDCDILITNTLQPLIDIPLEKKLYAVKEGNTNHGFHGAQFFKNNPKIPAFSSGAMLFLNCSEVKSLFHNIYTHIQEHLQKKLPIPYCLEQPFIIYHAITANCYDNTTCIPYIINNPGENFKGHIISHFSGVPGSFIRKNRKMHNYLNYFRKLSDDEKQSTLETT